MAGRGFAPDQGNALQRSRDKTPAVVLSSHGRVYGWPLPDDALEPGESWHPVVARWWEAWRRSPQAVTMATDADWFELLAAARVYQDFWRKSRGRTMAAGELRQRMAKFGATHEDRLRLRWSIELNEPTPDGDPSELPAVAHLDERRARLGG